MIKYSTSDIIKRAEQISDLENSDFITDYEKLALLNESWTILYEKLIEAGERTFVKTIEVEGTTDLPFDFYKVSRVYDETDELYTTGFEIINNKIKLTSTGKFCLEYYPKPRTLYLREKTVDSPFPDDVVTANRTLYLTYNGNSFRLEDVNDTDILVDIENDDYQDFALFDNAALIKTREGFEAVFKYEDTSLGIMTVEKPFIINNYLYLYNPEEKRIEDENGNIYKEGVELETEGVLYFYSDDILKNIYSFYIDHYTWNEETSVDISDRKLKLTWSNGYPYAITDTNKLVRCEEDRLFVMDSEHIPQFLVSENYVCTKKRMTSKRFLEGLKEDVLLEVPSNLFYSVLAYLLAIQFMAKQGQDTTIIQSTYDSYASQFFNSIQPIESYRIRNSYRTYFN